MYKVLSLILIMCLLVGCENILNATVGLEAKDVLTNGDLSLNEEVDLNYEVPASVPSILVNQIGYREESKKIAIFRGENLPEYFRVIDAMSGMQVFTGKIESKGYNSTKQEYNNYGVFTDLELVGEYYIEADIVGQSYPFLIGNNIYESVFESSYTLFARQGNYTNLSLEDTCYVLTNIMTSYELYEEEFLENTPEILETVKIYADKLLLAQNKTSGKLEDSEGKTAESITAHGAGVLGKISYVFSTYDSAYANECHAAAKKAWTYAQKNVKLIEADELFFAATEMYRLTGNSTYNKVIRDYIENEGSVKTGNTDLSFYGEITYLTTKRKVDTDICSQIMKRIMVETEEISEKSRAEKYLTSVNKDQNNFQEVLDSMVKMSVVDYVITNHEYATVLENHLHYFLGRNPATVSYIQGFGYKNTENKELDIFSNPRYNSAFLFMMSAISGHEEDGD